MNILLTGGAGYLGSAICSALADAGHKIIIIDLSVISGERLPQGQACFYQGDFADETLLNEIFAEHSVDIAIHCAEIPTPYKSLENPYDYYVSNVFKSMQFFKYLRSKGCRKIIFSSSAYIYDEVSGFKVTENSPLAPRSPFARAKNMTEMILKDFCFAYDMKAITFRYFNPVGADPFLRSGMHEKNPRNILSMLLRAVETDGVFKIAGTDWNTRDGTCIRDYIHVWDAALANVQAVANFDSAFELADETEKHYLALNIGSGLDVTVKEFIIAFENIYGQKVNVEEAPRRPGDYAGCYADVLKADKLIAWRAQRSIEEGIIDALRWEEQLALR